MIRYSTEPSKDANALTDSPTSPIKTTKDLKDLNDGGMPGESVLSEQDYDASDPNDN